MSFVRTVVTGAFSLTLLYAVPPEINGSVVQTEASEHPRERDLFALGEWVELEQGWPEGAKAHAHSAIQALLTSEQEWTDAEFFLEIASIVALADNGHSNVSMESISGG